MAVRSRRLMGPTLITSNRTLTARYTVPADRTAIIKTLAITNTDTVNAQGMYVRLNGTSGAASRFIGYFEIAKNSSVVLEHEIILNPGDFIALTPSPHDIIVWTLMGALLEGAPL